LRRDGVGVEWCFVVQTVLPHSRPSQERDGAEPAREVLELIAGDQPALSAR
jgi:hypothetical protein